MRLEKYQVRRTEEYEGGRQKITETRYRIRDNEGKVIDDDAQGTATNPPRRRESPTGIRPAVGEKEKTQERTAPQQCFWASFAQTLLPPPMPNIVRRNEVV